MRFNRVNIKLIEDKPIDDVKNKAKITNKLFIDIRK